MLCIVCSSSCTMDFMEEYVSDNDAETVPVPVWTDWIVKSNMMDNGTFWNSGDARIWNIWEYNGL